MVEVIKANMSFQLKNGHVLPNARSVSDLIHGQPQEDVEDSRNSLLGTVLKTIFYKVDVEKLNKPLICTILPYFLQLLGGTEFRKFAVYLVFHIVHLKKWCLNTLIREGS